jgi:hypothetical protein
MKKGILLILAAASLTASAQSKLGVRVAAGVSRVLPTDPSTTFRTSFAGGLAMEFKLAPKLRLHPELSYQLAGSGYGGPSTQYGLITLPLLLDVRVSPLLSLQAGPQAAYLLSAKNNSGADLSNGARRLDLGAAGGLALHITPLLSIDLRYQQSLRGMFPVTYVDGTGNIIRQGYEGRNQVLHAGLTLWLP